MSFVLAFAGFALLIILHEGGHFVAAKAVGMRVERFFLFFPPKLVSKRIGETEYGIGAIPLGGFVKITGMNPHELEAAEHGQPVGERGLLETIEGASRGPETPAGVESGVPLPPEVLERAYYNQPVWKRIVVIAAGPAVNISIAFVLLFALFLSVREPTRLEIGAVQQGTPAQGVLRSGDRLISVDGQPAALPALDRIKDPNQRASALDATSKSLAARINSHACPGPQTDHCIAATPATVVLDRGGQQLTLRLRPFYDTSVGRHRLGFQFVGGGLTTVSQSPGDAARLALDRMWFVTSRTVSVIGRIFNAQQRKQLTGIVGGYEVTRQAFAFDTRTAIFLLAVISLSLGVINLFPFLPLDGGHIFWSLVEKVRGRPVSFRTMERASAVGFMLVMVLFLIGFTNDIGRLTGQGFNIR